MADAQGDEGEKEGNMLNQSENAGSGSYRVPKAPFSGLTEGLEAMKHSIEEAMFRIEEDSDATRVADNARKRVEWISSVVEGHAEELKEARAAIKQLSEQRRHLEARVRVLEEDLGYVRRKRPIG